MPRTPLASALLMIAYVPSGVVVSVPTSAPSANRRAMRFAVTGRFGAVALRPLDSSHG